MFVSAGAARPGTTINDAGRGTWRLLIYGVKIPMWLSLSPLLGKLVADPSQQRTVRLAAVIALVAVSSYAKLFREEHPAAPKRH